jgi:folate-dependent phosphoribosylglycinamide formyltransferase PurN
MRVGITTDSSRNPYAAALICALSEAGVTPVSLISTEKSAAIKFRREINKNGVTTAFAKASHRMKGKRNNSPDRFRFLAAAYDAKQLNANLADLCQEKQIDLIRFKSVNTWETVRYVKENRLDILINAGGGIFRKAIVEAPVRGILNAHMGPLPEVRGMNALEWSLYLGMRPGVTLHYIDTGIDTGDILIFREIDVEPDDTIESLRAKSLAVSVEIMVKGVLGLADGSLKQMSQRPEDGKQYFVMHKRLARIVESRISANAALEIGSDDKSDDQLSLF